MIKNISKIFAILFSLVIAFSSVTAYAASLTVSPSSSTISVGDEITVTISLDGSQKAKSGGIEITHGDSLSYVSGSAHFNLTGTQLDNFDDSNMKGAFAYSSLSSISGDIITLKFTAKHDGTPNINAKLTLRDGNSIVLEESASVSITVGNGSSSTGSDTTANTTAQGQSTAHSETTEGSGEMADTTLAAADSATTYADASNSIFTRADGSVNITLIVIIIAVILVVITIIIVVKYNKKEKKSDQKTDKETEKNE